VNVTYRQAAPTDTPDIVQFQIRMARETEDLELDRDIVHKGVQAVFQDLSRGRYYIAERDGAAVGCLLTTYEWSDWRNGVVWWIQSVYVVPEARGQGVYAGLYAFLKHLANSDEQVKGVRLYVDRRNAQAQTVYKRLGMNGEHYRLFEWMKEF
jgi:RimJ/RimL family protein N-acetyltransferase